MTIGELRMMWVIGAAERLATLGLMGGDIPARIAAEGVETYMEIDDKRQFLFDNDYQLAECFTVAADCLSAEQIGKDDMNKMIELLLEYKNNRTELVRHVLSHQSV